ncbi:MAG TPA: hypothetical protein ENF53_04105 [Thermoprotei archaeon]|nr:hypothetical protein [Thermoprotei archaeon]
MNTYSLKSVREGRASIFVVDIKSLGLHHPCRSPVFYNPNMELSRNIDVAVLRAILDNLNFNLRNLVDLTAGTGIRGIRYALESIPHELKDYLKLFFVDKNKLACSILRRNIERNGLSKISMVLNEDSRLAILKIRYELNIHPCIIDIDPFGTPVPFMDCAFLALRNEGILMITATDMAPLQGIHPKACIRKYFSKPLKVRFSREIAVRILLGYIAREGAKYGISIEPLYAYSQKHFIRIIVRVKHGIKLCNNLLDKSIGYLYYCSKCGNKFMDNALYPNVERICNVCGSKLKVAGPLWTDLLWNVQLAKNVPKSYRELKHFFTKFVKEGENIVATIADEALINSPFHATDELASIHKVREFSPKKAVEMLRDSGFQASLTHFSPKGFRTNAGINNIIRIIRSL